MQFQKEFDSLSKPTMNHKDNPDEYNKQYNLWYYKTKAYAFTCKCGMITTKHSHKRHCSSRVHILLVNNEVN